VSFFVILGTLGLGKVAPRSKYDVSRGIAEIENGSSRLLGCNFHEKGLFKGLGFK